MFSKFYSCMFIRLFPSRLANILQLIIFSSHFLFGGFWFYFTDSFSQLFYYEYYEDEFLCYQCKNVKFIFSQTYSDSPTYASFHNTKYVYPEGLSNFYHYS